MEKNHLKKYRLIREYPGSPKLGTIIERIQDFSTPYNYGTKNRNFIVSSLNVEHHTKKNLEFWKEIVEKDYEILSYCQNSNRCGRFIYEKSHPNWGFIKKQNYEINTVKRLSDGEVFTVGDDIITEYNNHGTITKFELKFNNVCISTVSIKNGNIICFLKDLKSVKKPLFTTEDGVEILNNTDQWWVWGTNNKSFYKPQRVDILLAAQVLKGNDNFKYFSTKEAAEEYIIFNKPELSINDVLSLVPKLSTRTDRLRKDLIQLVKSKL